MLLLWLKSVCSVGGLCDWLLWGLICGALLASRCTWLSLCYFMYSINTHIDHIQGQIDEHSMNNVHFLACQFQWTSPPTYHLLSSTPNWAVLFNHSAAVVSLMAIISIQRSWHTVLVGHLVFHQIDGLGSLLYCGSGMNAIYGSSSSHSPVARACWVVLMGGRRKELGKTQSK